MTSSPGLLPEIILESVPFHLTLSTATLFWGELWRRCLTTSPLPRLEDSFRVDGVPSAGITALSNRSGWLLI